MPTNRSVRLAAVLAVVALVLSACGGKSSTSGPVAADAPDERAGTTGGTTNAEGMPPMQGPAAPAPATAVPDLAVVQLTGGQQIALTDVVPTDRPTLLWFWAPH